MLHFVKIRYQIRLMCLCRASAMEKNLPANLKYLFGKKVEKIQELKVHGNVFRLRGKFTGEPVRVSCAQNVCLSRISEQWQLLFLNQQSIFYPETQVVVLSGAILESVDTVSVLLDGMTVMGPSWRVRSVKQITCVTAALKDIWRFETKQELCKCCAHLLCTLLLSSSVQQRVAGGCCVGSGVLPDENWSNSLGGVQVCSGLNSAVASWRTLLWCWW